jgi:hypothetical protein
MAIISGRRDNSPSYVHSFYLSEVRIVPLQRKWQTSHYTEILETDKFSSSKCIDPWITMQTLNASSDKNRNTRNSHRKSRMGNSETHLYVFQMPLNYLTQNNLCKIAAAKPSLPAHLQHHNPEPIISQSTLSTSSITISTPNS